MVKFFRKIRQRFLTENNFSKYLIYAFGEIVLVVVGILFALQINNWNQNRKDRILEQEYYCRLLEDVLQDKEQIKDLSVAALKQLKASNQLILLLQQEKPDTREVGIKTLLSFRGGIDNFAPNDFAYEDIKSGSNLNLIRDLKLKKKLNKYFKNVHSYASTVAKNTTMSFDWFGANKNIFASGLVYAFDYFYDDMYTEDIWKEINRNKIQFVPEETKFQLYNAALFYGSLNKRRVEIYNLINNEIDIIKEALGKKCKNEIR